MLKYSFLNSIDKFKFTSGNIPILLIGSHNHCEGSNREKIYHECDFAVSPLMNKIMEKEKHTIYMLENMIHRSIIDMNRKISRFDINIEENDQFFRQMIRFVCSYIKFRHNKIPIVIDLHSFKSHTYWGDNDLMILIQKEKFMETDPSLSRFTEEFFRDRAYSIQKTHIHNQDDIVEELQYKDIANPILLEVNESLMRENRLYILAADLIKFAKTIAHKIEEVPVLIENDNRINPIDLNYYDYNKIDLDMNRLHNISDNDIKKSYSELLSLLSKNNLIIQSNDSFSSIKELTDNILDLSSNGSDFDELVINVIKTISNRNDSIIVPYEKIFIIVKSMYNKINRKALLEYGLTDSSLPYISSINFLKKGFPKSEIPLFEKDPYIEYNFLFSSIRNGEKFQSFIVLIDNKENISKESLKRDRDFLKGKISTKIISKI